MAEIIGAGGGRLSEIMTLATSDFVNVFITANLRIGGNQWRKCCWENRSPTR